MKKLEQLPPNTWLESLKQWEKQLKAIIQEIKHQQHPETADVITTPSASVPKLHISTSHNSVQYYQFDTINKKKRKYLSKKELNSIKNMAQQEYNLKIQKALEKEQHQIEKFLATYQKQNTSTIYKKLSAARRSLIIPLTLPTADYARAWQQIEYHHKPFVQNAPEYYTQNGERVRSKSEILIANTLAQHHIPYRYEYPIHLQNRTVHPDFLCLNPRTRREYLWEHLGLLDNPAYLAKNLTKLLDYEKSGYFPGHQLILTIETAALPLSVIQIKNVIKEYLL